MYKINNWKQLEKAQLLMGYFSVSPNLSAHNNLNRGHFPIPQGYYCYYCYFRGILVNTYWPGICGGLYVGSG